MRRWTARNGGVELGGEAGGSSELGPPEGGTGWGKKKKKVGDNLVLVSPGKVRSWRTRGKEEGRGRAAEDGGATEGRWMGGGEVVGEGSAWQEEAEEEEETKRGRQRDGARRKARKRDRVGKQKWGRREKIGAAAGSRRKLKGDTHTQSEIPRERRGQRQRRKEKARDRGEMGVGKDFEERMGVRIWVAGGRKTRESHPERGRRDRWGDRQKRD